MEERLSNAYKLIEDLNEKLRRATDGGSGKGSIAQVLQKIREQLNAEFERYRCDTEESMKRTLTEMKMRLDLRLRENQRLQEEKDRLEEILAKMKGELNQIQSQVRDTLIVHYISRFIYVFTRDSICAGARAIARPSVRHTGG